ncbi:MAG: 3-hydroxyacyl-CoA dehydrogenase/enoyl-CoA hydratase family protein [Myxococcales bacterium]|nr:3-hydroxyacyl-CoA dehydrogenase/enoyl-CoA hydratase family protein [Myxococcales bacterium]
MTIGTPRQIRKVAVLGAGVMGQGIAAHLANAGIDSLLFDIPPRGYDAAAAGGDNKGADIRAVSKAGVANLAKLKPAPLYRAADAARISPCEYDTDAARLAECDLIIEAVAEMLIIKQKVFAWVEKNRKAGAIVSSNTSGIPIAALTAGWSAELRSDFLVMHFFNPVRYMRLLELVAGPDTSPAVVRTIHDFGERVLGKGIVYGKDTPAFIANRVGTFGMVSIFKHMVAGGFTVEQVDAIWGKPMGRPGSAVFRTADLVGLDTLAHVIHGIHDGCPNDEHREDFVVPSFVQKLIDAGSLGEKSGVGFYKKTKNAEGKTEILALNAETGEYAPQGKVRFDALGAARKAEGSIESAKIILNHPDKAGQFAWNVTADVLIYAANRVGEIADDVVNIDNAMKWGFAWDHGPFESWDALGVPETVGRLEKDGHVVPNWVKDMLASGRTKFYDRPASGDLAGQRSFWSSGGSGAITRVPQSAGQLKLEDVRANGGEIKSNVSASLLDLGDRVLCLEFHSKMNALDDMIFPMYAEALDMLDAGRFEALVVGNQGHVGSTGAFCAGANILMILMGAMQQDWKGIETAVNGMQQLLMRAKFSEKPVVTAPWGLTLGGGVEVTMHAAATVAAGELYAGLVEVGVGLIPGGGGCKELLARYMGDIPAGVAYDPNPFVQKAFEHIGMAKVATSCEEARDAGFLRPTDHVTLDPDRQIADAKRLALGLVAGGYKPPRKRTFKLPGASGRGAIEAFLFQMRQGGYATPHDAVVGKKLAYVMTGGDCPVGATRGEQDILDLEREVFLQLCGHPDTQARIQHMLEKGKPLRN